MQRLRKLALVLVDVGSVTTLLLQDRPTDLLVEPCVPDGRQVSRSELLSAEIVPYVLG